MYNSIYTGNQNKIVYDLECTYNINNLLTVLDQRFSNNRRICMHVERIREAIHGQNIWVSRIN